jgi:HK97 family phage major capsid protein
MDMTEIKSLIDKQGEAFEAFKATLETEMKSKLGKDDPIVNEKLAKIEKSLDTSVEAHAAILAKVEAEAKARQDLELKLGRMNLSGHSEESAKAAIELKSFNDTMGALAAQRGRSYTPVDAKGLADYKAALEVYERHGRDALTPDEIKTLSVGSDPDGGYWVTPDTTGRIVKKVYETSPIRQIASVQTISTDALEGIEDLGEAGAGYAGETAQGSDTTTPQIGKWTIPVYWIDTEPKTTQQLLDDAVVDVEGWLSDKVGDKLGRFENNEFVNGATKIRGFTSYPTADDSGSGVAWGSIGQIKTAQNGDFPSSTPADKLFDLVGLVKEAYLANSRWVTRRSVITKIRKFKESTTNGYIWQPGLQAGVPEMLLGYPVTRAEDVPALATNSLSLWFADFRAAYQVVDRQGVRVLRDNLTSKPYVKFYTTKRTGGGVVNFEAIKAMNFGS